MLVYWRRLLACRQQTLVERREAKRCKRQAKEGAEAATRAVAGPEHKRHKAEDPTRVWRHEEASRDKRKRRQARLRARALAEAKAAGHAPPVLSTVTQAALAVTPPWAGDLGRAVTAGAVAPPAAQGAPLALVRPGRLPCLGAVC